MKSGIVLIGMAGAGKSTVGKILAEKLNRKFIDGDEYIEKKEKAALKKIIGLKGEKEFLKIEEKRISELLPLKNKVITPGGSVIYSEKLMRRLRSSALLIWLDSPFSVIKKRLAGEREENVIGRRSKSLKQIFLERRPIYEKHADIRIDCRGKSSELVAETIKNHLNIRKGRI